MVALIEHTIWGNTDLSSLGSAGYNDLGGGGWTAANFYPLGAPAGTVLVGGRIWNPATGGPWDSGTLTARISYWLPPAGTGPIASNKGYSPNDIIIALGATAQSAVITFPSTPGWVSYRFPTPVALNPGDGVVIGWSIGPGNLYTALPGNSMPGGQQVSTPATDGFKWYLSEHALPGPARGLYGNWVSSTEEAGSNWSYNGGYYGADIILGEPSAGAPTHTTTATGGVTLSGTNTVVSKLVRTATGGVTLSGTNTVISKLVRTSTGGVVLSGVGALAASQTKTASGGVVLSGNVTQTTQIVTVASGGVVLSGIVTQTTQIVTVASGGVVLSGVGATASSIIRTATGGIVLSGSVVTTVKQIQTPSGGFTLSGTAPIQLILATTATGGLSLSGIGALESTSTKTASGGISLSGTALVSIQSVRTATNGVVLSGNANVITQISMSSVGGVVLSGISLAVLRQIRTASGEIKLYGLGIIGDLPLFPDIMTLTPQSAKTLTSEDSPRKITSFSSSHTLEGEPYGRNNKR